MGLKRLIFLLFSGLYRSMAAVLRMPVATYHIIRYAALTQKWDGRDATEVRRL